MLQCFNLAMLQSCNAAMLQNCNVTMLQSCNVAMWQYGKVATWLSTDVQMYGRTGGLLELLSQLKKKLFYQQNNTGESCQLEFLLSQTLKVEEKKVPLFFCFAASFPRYGHFMKKHVPGTKSENGQIWAKKA